jgi:uncharacterized protein with HEPN domain
LRYELVQNYDNMDEDEIWRAVSADIPKLKDDCGGIMRLE